MTAAPARKQIYVRKEFIMGEKAVLLEFLIAMLMGLGALSIFIWAVLSDHFEETEDIKFRILAREMEDEERDI